jgi:hypothetical protein
MEKPALNQEIIREMTQLLNKTGFESFAPGITDSETEDENSEAFLINLKALNAKYEKSEAIAQVKALMQRYNIQIDELMEQIKYDG